MKEESARQNGQSFAYIYMELFFRFFMPVPYTRGHYTVDVCSRVFDAKLRNIDCVGPIYNVIYIAPIFYPIYILKLRSMRVNVKSVLLPHKGADVHAGFVE